MHDPVRYTAQQETVEPLPPMGADYDELVATSCLAHTRDGITHADIGRYGEVWTGQRLGCVVYDLFNLPLIFLRPAFESRHKMWVDQMQRGDDRQDGGCDGVLEGVRGQPGAQTGRVLAIFHCDEDASDRVSFSFHDQGWNCGMEQDTMRQTAGEQFGDTAVIVRAHDDEVRLDCDGAVENEGGWVL